MCCHEGQDVGHAGGSTWLQCNMSSMFRTWCDAWGDSKGLRNIAQFRQWYVLPNEVCTLAIWMEALVLDSIGIQREKYGTLWFVDGSNEGFRYPSIHDVSLQPSLPDWCLSCCCSIWALSGAACILTTAQQKQNWNGVMVATLLRASTFGFNILVPGIFAGHKNCPWEWANSTCLSSKWQCWLWEQIWIGYQKTLMEEPQVGKTNWLCEVPTQIGRERISEN